MFATEGEVDVGKKSTAEQINEKPSEREVGLYRSKKFPRCPSASVRNAGDYG
jgi:hypothetical protein